MNVKLTDIEIPTPLCIVRDRYGGTYSGASYLAFNLTPHTVASLPINACDLDCEKFWNNEDEDYKERDYIIGKGVSPNEALLDLVFKLKEEAEDYEMSLWRNRLKDLTISKSSINHALNVYKTYGTNYIFIDCLYFDIVTCYLKNCGIEGPEYDLGEILSEETFRTTFNNNMRLQGLRATLIPEAFSALHMYISTLLLEEQIAHKDIMDVLREKGIEPVSGRELKGNWDDSWFL